MPFDFPSDPHSRVTQYAQTLRAAHGDLSYPGGRRIVVRRDDGTYRHCAVGILIRDYYGVSADMMMQTWNGGIALKYHEQIVEDLHECGLPRAFLTNRHDFQHMSLDQMATELEGALCHV